MSEPDFKVGDRVEKCTSDYHWRGQVRAVFQICEGGRWRIVVAHAIEPSQGRGYVLHIYSPDNLRKTDG